MHGSALTPGEIQGNENKEGRLQRLINAFEHQADLFLLRQSSLDDVVIHPVGTYTQYDQPDQPGAPMGMDPEHPTTLTSHTVPEGDSDGSGMSLTNPADLLIPLSSTLGWEWCVSHGVQTLALKEAQLQLAQANELIHKICLSLGFKSAI